MMAEGAHLMSHLKGRGGEIKSENKDERRKSDVRRA